MKKLVCSCVFAFLLPYPTLLLSQQNFPAELVRRETTIQIHEGKLQQKEALLIKINKRDGDRYAEIDIPFSKRVRIKDLEGCLMDSQQQVIRKMKKGDITERSLVSDISMYDDQYIKEFKLKHSDYPYFIEYSYLVEQEEFVVVADWVPVLDYPIPTITASLTVITDPDYPVNIYSRRAEQTMDRTILFQRQCRWEASYDGSVKPEVFSAPLEEWVPEIIVVPEDFKYGITGKQDSWKSFSQWEYQLNIGQRHLPAIEQERIHAMTKDISPVKEKIRRLYHYLQDNTRYVSIAVDIGGLKTYPADYVAKNKYGDCKALTNYFQAMLDVIGVGSYYCNVNAGGKIIQVIHDLPAQQFNHVILMVPIEGDTLWLDCTSKGPFNYLGTFTQGRYALVTGPEQGRLLKTPALDLMDVCCERKIVCNQYNGHLTAISVQETFRGENYERLQMANRSMNATQKRQYLLNHFTMYGAQVSDIRIDAPDRDNPAIALYYSGYHSNIYSSYGEETFIKPVAFQIPVLEAPEKRKNPVQIDFPLYLVDTLDFTVSRQDTLLHNIQDLTLETEYGSYNITLVHEGERVRIIKQFILLPNKYDISEYPGFYDFVNTIKEYEKYNTLVSRKR